jgi:hypothetical protein
MKNCRPCSGITESLFKALYGIKGLLLSWLVIRNGPVELEGIFCVQAVASHLSGERLSTLCFRPVDRSLAEAVIMK